VTNLTLRPNLLHIFIEAPSVISARLLQVFIAPLAKCHWDCENGSEAIIRFMAAALIKHRQYDMDV